MSQRNYSAEGCVVRRKDLGEKDKLIVLFSREFGKITAIAKGSRQPGSALAGCTEVLCFSKFQLARGRQFDYVTQAQPLRTFVHLRQDLTRTSLALEIAEIVERTSSERQPNESEYDLVLLAFELLDHATDPWAVSAWAHFRLLDLLGYAPRIEECVGCRRRIRAPAAFSAVAGGLLCASCSEGQRGVLGLPSAAVSELQSLARAKEPPPALRAVGALRRVSRAAWRNVLDADLKSSDFVDNMLRLT